MSRTPMSLLDKLWQEHLVVEGTDGLPDLLYIDLHLVHEISSPQAFAGLLDSGRPVRRPDLTLAVADHVVPTSRRDLPIADQRVQEQLSVLSANAERFGVPIYDLNSNRQGIVHVIAPELGLSQPGSTIVCGDSHTSTHGALGALAFGIGSSEIEHVLATQTLAITRPKSMRITLMGTVVPGVSAKDIALAVISQTGTNGAAGHFIEFEGEPVRALSIEQRMTLCNMSIEAGARAALVAPDDVTLDYLKGRPHAPTGADWDAASAYWRTLRSDPGARFDRELTLDVSTVAPIVTWGTTPAMSAPASGRVPAAADTEDPATTARALEYMGLRGGELISEIPIDAAFIGSCTNGRLEDLRAAAEVLRGRHVSPGVRALAVPGSMMVRQAAEREGLDRVFIDAGFEWRNAGCSLCVALNDDQLLPGQRCASTSNRNFEGRQGAGGRTHLMSPAQVAIAACLGRLGEAKDLPTREAATMEEHA